MQKNINSLITFRNSQGTEARGTLLKLSRTTIVFEVYNPYSIVQLSEVLQDLTVRRNEQVIYKGKAVVSNLMNTGLMLVVSATLVDTWSDLTDLVESNKDLSKVEDEFVSAWRKHHQIRPGYQLAVGEIRSFLGELSRWLEQLDLINDSQSTGQNAIFSELEPPLAPQLKELLEHFENEAAHITQEELSIHKTFAQDDLHPLIMNSPFTHRIFTKPLGYAGDHEMVNMIWRNCHEGPSTYAKLINKLHLEFAAAEAHRNRINILTDRIIQACEKARAHGRPARILNIGCGPALEIQKFIEKYPLLEYADFRLMDFNQETLDITRDRLSSAMKYKEQKPTIEYKLKSVYTLLKQASTKKPDDEPESEEAGYDLVYCAGLFDYLADKACAQLLKIFFNWTAPGGLVLATNVHPKNNATNWMEHILEWHLIYRDETDMKELIPGVGDQIVYADKTGVNVFLEIQK